VGLNCEVEGGQSICLRINSGYRMWFFDVWMVMADLVGWWQICVAYYYKTFETLHMTLIRTLTGSSIQTKETQHRVSSALVAARVWCYSSFSTL
jgi:hypothetical protein